MPELHYKDGGTWRKAKELHYRDGGVWRKLKEAWYRDGGVWRKVFSAGGVVNPLPFTYWIDVTTLSPADATAAIQFRSDGVLNIYGSLGIDALSWFAPTEVGIGAAYWIRLTVTSGDGPNSGDSTGAWLSLSVTRTWSWTVTSNSGGLRSGVVTVQIATDSAGSNIVASKTGVNISATVEI